MFKTFFGLAGIQAVYAAGGDKIDYTQLGANWGEEYPLCSEGKEQTPIDLSTSWSEYNSNLMMNMEGYMNLD